MDLRLLIEPIGNTCPDINKVIGHINEADDYLNDAEKNADYAKQQLDNEYHHYINDISDAVSNARHEISGLIDKLEELRRDNERLRAWGLKLVEEVKYLDGK